MSDRFDFLEIGNAPRSTPVPPADANGGLEGSGTGWKQLRLRPVEVIGEPGAQAGQFNAPTSLTVDRDGALYVVDSNNHRVQRIAMNGDVKIYGRAGEAPGQMWGPQAVAIHPSGQLFYVAEQGNNRLQCFELNGQHRGIIPGFKTPSGVVFDLQGMMWVADTGNGRLLRYDPRGGQCLGQMDRSCGITRPIALACDNAGHLYVTDGFTNDVTRYNYAGQRVHAISDVRRLSLPRQVAVDADGRVYVAESGANRLHVLDGSSYSLLTVETPMQKLGAFKQPSGVALGPRGEIYVADTLNHRILRLAWE